MEPQVTRFLKRQLKHEVAGESPDITLDSSIQGLLQLLIELARFMPDSFSGRMIVAS